MEWVDRMNRVMDYLEEHLCDDVNPEEISRIMACPYAVFQRSFAPVTGVSLSEYLRRRRLSCAAQELLNTSERILDIAVRYGYESADAFTAAFRRMHGVGPSQARSKEERLKFYPRLHLTLMITGVSEMDYKVVERKACRMLGVRRTTPFGGGTWGIVKTDGSSDRLKELCGHPCDLGLCFGFDADGSNDYMCAVEYDDKAAPGLDVYAYPKVTMLVFCAKGTITGGTLQEVWKRIYGEFMPQSAYRQRDLPTIEKYIEWDEQGDRCHVEIMIPVEE